MTNQIDELIEKIEKKILEKKSDPWAYWYNVDKTVWYCSALNDTIADLQQLKQELDKEEMEIKKMADKNFLVRCPKCYSPSKPVYIISQDNYCPQCGRKIKRVD